MPRFDFAIAQSLFTHLTKDDIATCFRNLRPVAQPESRFYFTYKPGDSATNPSENSHAQKGWKYEFSEFEEIGHSTDWTMEFIGDWEHPRGQQMAVATPS